MVRWWMLASFTLEDLSAFQCSSLMLSTGNVLGFALLR